MALRCGGARLRDGPSGRTRDNGRSGSERRESGGGVCLPGGATRPPPVTSRSAADVDAPPWRSPPERSRPHTDLGEADPGIPKHPAWGDLCRVGAARRAGHRSSLSSVLKQHFRARHMRTERRLGALLSASTGAFCLRRDERSVRSPTSGTGCDVAFHPHCDIVRYHWR